MLTVTVGRDGSGNKQHPGAVGEPVLGHALDRGDLRPGSPARASIPAQNKQVKTNSRRMKGPSRSVSTPGLSGY